MAATQKRKEITTLIVVFTGVVVVSALVAYYLGGGRQTPTNTTQTGVEPGSTRPTVEPPRAGEQPVTRPNIDPRADQSTATLERQPTSAPGVAGAEESFIDRMFGTHAEQHSLGATWSEAMGRITLRFLLAALLGAALAFRPRKRILAIKRNPYVAQTQILLAIVAAALMIVVGDNAARAFGIFAAVSLVRFRTNIRDPKEITVLLISLALGLSAGVGRWDLALVLTLFSLVVLWLLEWREPELVFRSMELKVTTRNVVSTQKALRQVFKQHGFDKELRAIDREATEESPGSIMYSVDVSPTVSTDEISADILALDGQNVEGIEWDQKKSYSYLYQ
ncbi:MAG TPA: DUF4956 domain-containing protein [Pyrinomonadaceae bacterium]|nr:DUF4956 domain-containing protein [Pyrinomonadaceae bacterium]